MTLAQTIIERFSILEAGRGHSPEYVGSLVNCQSLQELVDEVSMWVNETEGNKDKAREYIFEILDTPNY
jgi:hypothetical protein